MAKPTVELRANAITSRQLGLIDAIRSLNKVDHDYALRKIAATIDAMVQLQRTLIQNQKAPKQ